MKDLIQLDPHVPRLARIAIWDSLPGVPGVTVEDAVHRIPEPRFADGMRALIAERAGGSL